MISVRPLRAEDAGAWTDLRLALWPDQSLAELAADVARFLNTRSRGPGTMPEAVFVATDDAPGAPALVGFAEISRRLFAEGCTTSPVGFLEGWYVRPEWRRRGVGRALVAASESWARDLGCREFASDALADNTLSLEAHLRLGFTEVEVIRCFRKDLAPQADGAGHDRAARFALDGIDHVALAVRDVAASARWYIDVLGLERMYEDVWGNHPAVVGTGGAALALFPVERPESAPPTRYAIAMRHFAFRANAHNFAAAERALTGAGIAFTSQHHGISKSIYFRDPDGHEIEITTYDLS